MPELIPPHQGLAAPVILAAILVDNDMRSAQVFGTVRPFALKYLGEYQTSDFMFALMGAA